MLRTVKSIDEDSWAQWRALTTTSSSPSNAVCVQLGIVTLKRHPGVAAMSAQPSLSLRKHHRGLRNLPEFRTA